VAERWRKPFASSEAARQRMVGQRRRDTAPELQLRRALHARGLRYYVHRQPSPGLRRQADVVFPRARVAVFMDGCFWHGCPEHGRKANGANGWYWPEKIERNRARDADTNAQLAAAGWVAVRVWEHECAETAASRVEATVQMRSRSASGLRHLGQRSHVRVDSTPLIANRAPTRP
jgi:DNA mismatch endonuclease (patch repair protein)